MIAIFTSNMFKEQPTAQEDDLQWAITSLHGLFNSDLCTGQLGQLGFVFLSTIYIYICVCVYIK